MRALKTLTGGGRTNTWDSQNRLVNCVYGSNTSSYIYGSDGFRHRSTVNGTTTDFALDGQFFVRELQGGAQYATYLTGPTGPLYRRDASGTTLRWYIYDGLGSVLGEVDASGNLDATRTYDVYGLARSSTGTATSKHGWVGQLGHTSEPETGLVYMRARYYDPTVGRFVSEDPARSGANWFDYAADRPTVLVDNDGRSVNNVLGFLYQLADQLGRDTEVGSLLMSLAYKIVKMAIDPLEAAELLMTAALDDLRIISKQAALDAMQMLGGEMKSLASNDLWFRIGIAKAANGLIGLANSIDETALVMQAAVLMVAMSIDEDVGGGF